MTNNVTARPNHVGRQILAGLQSTKEKAPGDRVATTVDVTTPQVTPPGSPVDGQVAVPFGAPVEDYITIVLDTSAFDEDADCVGIIGDSSRVFQNSCSGCNAEENEASVYIKSPTCNLYETFLNRLCSTPYVFASASMRVRKTAGATGDIELPESISWNRQNLNGVGEFGIVEISNMEDLSAFERSAVRYVDVALQGKVSLFDRDTRWKIPGLKGKRKYEITLYTGFRKDN